MDNSQTRGRDLSSDRHHLAYIFQEAQLHPQDATTRSSSIAKARLRGREDEFEFGLVESAADWEGIRQLRLRMYSGKRKYLQSLVNDEGYDEFDGHSFLFFAKHEGEYIASVRLTRYPFETSKYLSHDQLQDFLGEGYESEFLEVGRLVADPHVRILNISYAMLAYAISMGAMISNHSGYLAYSHPRLKQKAFRYHQAPETQNFYIPERRSSEYVLFKGDLEEEFAALSRDSIGYLE